MTELKTSSNAIDKSKLFTSKEAAKILNVNNNAITKIFRELSIRPTYEKTIRHGYIYFWTVEQFSNKHVIRELTFLNKLLNKKTISSSLKHYIKNRVKMIEEEKEKRKLELANEKKLRDEKALKEKTDKKIIHDEYSKLFKEEILKTWDANTKTDYVIHVGKTNSGKTYNAIKRLIEAGDGIYLAPLRLLAWEIFDKINGDDKFICSLITGEEQITSPHTRMFSATIEMADFNREYEVAIIDESFMIGDKDRGKSWLNAMLRLKAKEVHIIVNEEALEIITNILDLTNRGYQVKKYEMLQKFKFTEKQFEFSKNIPKRGVFVTFSRMEVLINKAKIQNLGFNVSVLYGNLPPEVKKAQILDFIEGRSDFLVTTDVIGMGINVPCDYIIFLESSKFDGTNTRRLTPIEVKQISGRTGRYGMSNENSFVSALNKNDLKYIKSAYNINSKIDKAYFGLSWEIFSSFPENISIKSRIGYFKEIDFIPERLKSLIQKEDVQKYLDVHYTIDCQNNLDLKTKWHFLTSPIKNNNSNYFNKCITGYNKSGILPVPNINIMDYSDSKQLEDKISEIELYLNLSRHLSHEPNEKLRITDDKLQLIDKLTKMIMDKKLSSKKKCKLCTTMMSITYPYPYCNDCFENKVRRQYDFDNY